MDLSEILSKAHLAEYVSGYVTGVIMTWAFMQRTFIKDGKLRVAELKDRIEKLESRLVHLEDSRLEIALTNNINTERSNKDSNFKPSN